MAGADVRPCRCGWGSQRCCWTAWSQAGTTASGCRACEGQRPVRPGASAPGPVSARPTGCHPSGQSCRCGPQGLHGWRAPDPAQWPHQPGCMLGEAGRLVPEALLCSAGPLAPHKRLNFSDVSHDSARVSWEGPPRPVRPCRVSYVSGEGGHSGQVRAGRCPGAPECPRRCWCPEPPPSPVSAVGWGKHGSATLSQPLGTPVWREREGVDANEGPPSRFTVDGRPAPRLKARWAV